MVYYDALTRLIERGREKCDLLIRGFLSFHAEKRKNDGLEEKKKMLKIETPTAPSITSDEASHRNEEEEFTFTDSIMEELAYKDE